MAVTLNEYTTILSESGIYNNRKNFIFYTNQLFKDIDFRNRRVLEIGAGKGAFSCYFALREAKKVVALEPESDGSNPQMLKIFNQLIERSGVAAQVELKPLNFQQYFAADESFDIIISHNSINHLDEQACIHLLTDSSSEETYLALFEKMNKLLAKDGLVLIADCARFNFWGNLKIKTPVTRAIDWNKHQQPTRWSMLLERRGFTRLFIRWNTLNGMRGLGRILFGNKVASYFINSHFSMLLRKS